MTLHGFGARGFGRGRKVPVWIALMIILALMVDAAAWKVRDEPVHKSEERVTKPTSWGLRTSFDAAAAFM